jgi:hypothetical protein
LPENILCAIRRYRVELAAALAAVAYYPRFIKLPAGMETYPQAAASSGPFVILTPRTASYSAHARSDKSETYLLRSSGTLPPFSASLIITCLCSHTFIAAVSFVSPE